MPQAQDRTSFPGCTFASDSEIATNPDYSTLYQNLQHSGLNASLSDLDAVVTLFAPTNQAFAQFKIANNKTSEQLMPQPPTDDKADAVLFSIFSSYHITVEALPVSLRTANAYRSSICTSCLHPSLLFGMHYRSCKCRCMACSSTGYSLGCCTHSFVVAVSFILHRAECLHADRNVHHVCSEDMSRSWCCICCTEHPMLFPYVKLEPLCSCSSITRLHQTASDCSILLSGN